MVEELVVETLQDYQPHFCENISQLGSDKLMAWVSTDDVTCSGVIICMSIDTESETKFFEIFKKKRLSSIPEAMNKRKKTMVVNYNALSKEKRDTTEIELSREYIEQHYGKTMKKAAEELGVSVFALKRKHSNWKCPGGKDQIYRRERHFTPTKIKNEIDKKFKLKHGTSKIRYLDEDEEWILITSKQDLSDCIQNSRNVDRSAVRLLVLLHNQ
ncbi:NIN-like protein [Tanacetum coccineum]